MTRSPLAMKARVVEHNTECHYCSARAGAAHRYGCPDSLSPDTRSEAIKQWHAGREAALKGAVNEYMTEPSYRLGVVTAQIPH